MSKETHSENTAATCSIIPLCQVLKNIASVFSCNFYQGVWHSHKNITSVPCV